MKKRIIVIGTVIILLVLTGCFWFGHNTSQSNQNELSLNHSEIKSGVITNSPIGPIGAQYTDSSLFLSAIKQNPAVVLNRRVTGLIVPHHLLAIDLTAKTLAAAANGKYRNIVLLSPDHFQAGQKDVAITERNFSTVFGEVKTAGNISRQLKKLPFVSEGDFFYREHGLQAILPFIRYYFPEAEVTAITFKPATDKAELDQIIETLEKNLPADSLIIQSTDFSHYLTPAQAAVRDQLSIKTIKEADPEKIWQLQQPDNLDSIAALYVQARLQKDFFQSTADIRDHKNSQDYTASQVASSTSYITAAYTQPAKPAGEAELIFVGDIMLSRHIGEIMAKRQDYDFPFAKIKTFLSSADLVFGNLESPISSGGKSTGNLYSFRADPVAVFGLKNAGFKVLSVANNHAFDYGRTAFSDTLDNLQQVGLAYTGGGHDFTEAHRGARLEINGIKIAFLAYTDLLPPTTAASDKQAGIAYLDQNQMIVDIKAAKEKSDLVIVSFHWGREYETQSNERQKNIAAAAIKAGASLIVGHHPHVAQEVVDLQGTTVAYSLGNFIFDQNFSDDTRNGLMLGVTVKDKKIKDVRSYTINFNQNFQPYRVFADNQ